MSPAMANRITQYKQEQANGQRWHSPSINDYKLEFAMFVAGPKVLIDAQSRFLPEQYARCTRGQVSFII